MILRVFQLPTDELQKMDQTHLLPMLIVAFVDWCRGLPINANSPPNLTPATSVTLDLTYAFDENTIYWPTATQFRHDRVYRGDTPGGYYYENNDISASEHGGTHLDAPSHFCNPQGKGTPFIH